MDALRQHHHDALRVVAIEGLEHGNAGAVPNPDVHHRRVGLMFVIESEGGGFVEAKTLRVLAVASDRRLPQAPDVPTLIEAGYPVTAGTIRGVTFTAGVPKAAVTTMEAALEQVHKSAAWKEIVKRNIYQDVFMGSAEFTKFSASLSLTPMDLERVFGLIGGDIFHGALSLNQLFSARPMVGQADYRGAVPGLYLCGAGTHPGGGVTGAPGHNAAKVVIADLR